MKAADELPPKQNIQGSFVRVAKDPLVDERNVHSAALSSEAFARCGVFTPSSVGSDTDGAGKLALLALALMEANKQIHTLGGAAAAARTRRC